MQKCECGCQSMVSKRFARGHGNRQSGACAVVEESGYQTPCWIWKLGLNTNGYANPRVRGRKVVFHRYLFESINGRLPLGMELDHLCRNRNCIRPDHLEVVTHTENVRRGRRTKLTAAKVEQAFDLANKGLKLGQIGEIIGISRGAVGHILRGMIWKRGV